MLIGATKKIQRRDFSISNFPPSSQPFGCNAAESTSASELEHHLRQQLARELHDGPVQTVSNAVMNLMVAQNHLERDPNGARAELSNSIAMMQRAVEEMRAMMFELRPMLLETEGLLPALRELAAHLAKTTTLDVQLDIPRSDIAAPLPIATNVYYIAQEAAQNAIKHARATRIQISLKQVDDTLFLSIRDNGLGFNVERVQNEYEKRKSLGLVNLYERAELIQGHLTLDSLVGHGTTIRLTVPLDSKRI